MKFFAEIYIEMHENNRGNFEEQVGEKPFYLYQNT